MIENSNLAYIVAPGEIGSIDAQAMHFFGQHGSDGLIAVLFGAGAP
jgi:hypothetical protein